MSDTLPAHSKLGPSASKRWLVCHGSVKATEDLPDTSSVYAREGTAAHTLSEWVREQGKPAKDFIGQEIYVEGDRIVVNWEMVHAVQAYVDYCNELPGEAYVEERVHYDAFIPGGFGTSDDIRIDNEDCYITDLKYGKGVPEHAENNTQGMFYALGVFQDFGHLYDFKRFHIAIHQPRLESVSSWTISVEDLLIWVRDVAIPAYESAMGPNPPFVAGDHCQFCPLKQSCKTRADAMQAEYLNDLDGPEEMTGEELAEISDRLSAIRAWCNDIEAHALSEVQKGHQVGDWKLVEGRSNRTWKNAEEAEKALRGTKLKVKEIFVKKMISPKQAEDLLGKDHPLMKEQVRKPPGRPVLVPGSDSRPPLQVNAEDEFEDLSQGD